MLNQPKHIGEGMYQAAQSIYNGLEGGITGLVKKPYEEAKRDGVFGFFKGAFLGISGLVTKPVSGVLDATAKTA